MGFVTTVGTVFVVKWGTISVSTTAVCSTTVEFTTWVIINTRYKLMDLVTYPRPSLSLSLLVKQTPNLNLKIKDIFAECPMGHLNVSGREGQDSRATRANASGVQMPAVMGHRGQNGVLTVRSSQLGLAWRTISWDTIIDWVKSILCMSPPRNI